MNVCLVFWFWMYYILEMLFKVEDEIADFAIHFNLSDEMILLRILVNFLWFTDPVDNVKDPNDLLEYIDVDCSFHTHLLQLDESVTTGYAVVDFLVVSIQNFGYGYGYNYRYSNFNDDVFHGNAPTVKV